MEQNEILIQKVEELLKTVIHPAHKQDIVTLKIVENIMIKDDNSISVWLAFAGKDPLISSIKKATQYTIEEYFPELKNKVTIFVKETQKKETPKTPESLSAGIKKIVAISSAKGGVGKSTVTANIAAMMAKRGYKVGILDSDIYGPSIPLMYGVENHIPDGQQVNGVDAIIPAESHGVKIMSIGFFISPEDALVWRGPMATNALKQMIHQTLWGDLDYLFVDMPPGTGDIHLTLIHELKVDGVIIVSTPQKVALADVVRGVSMYKAENINLPVWGVVENMSWFSPADNPTKRYYIFGHNACSQLVEKEGLTTLARIPLILAEEEDPSPLHSIVIDSAAGEAVYQEVTEQIINK